MRLEKVADERPRRPHYEGSQPPSSTLILSAARNDKAASVDVGFAVELVGKTLLPRINKFAPDGASGNKAYLRAASLGWASPGAIDRYVSISLGELTVGEDCATGLILQWKPISPTRPFIRFID
jgi:hypothetical protein